MSEEGSAEKTFYNQITDANTDAAMSLVGKLLTLADASLTDERQLKAFKDMLKSIIWDAESRSHLVIRRRLYDCREAGAAMFPSYIEERVKMEVAATI